MKEETTTIQEIVTMSFAFIFIGILFLFIFQSGRWFQVFLDQPVINPLVCEKI